MGDNVKMKKKIKSVHLIKEKDLTENFANPFEAVEDIDPDNYIFKNVCLMSRKESLNNRVYSDQAIDSLTSFVNGSKCFINHISKEEKKQRSGVRDLRDFAGVFEGAYRKGDGVFANLKVREAYFDLFKDIATMNPKGLGHSIDARVKVFQDATSGMENVVDVANLNSCDIVVSPALTTNLWESVDETINKNLKDQPQEVLFTEEYVEFKIEKLFNEAIIEEGLIQDKLDNDKIRQDINDITYTANDLIRDVLYDEKATIQDKKSKISNIFDDLSKEVKGKLKGIKEQKESEEMFTLEEVKENKEIFEAIKNEILSGLKVSQTETNLQEAIKWNEAVEVELTTVRETLKTKEDEVEYVTAACQEAEKERDVLKKKVDDVEVAKFVKEKKEFIEAMIETSKVPKEGKSEVFMEALMKEDTVEAIQKLIDDRKNIFASDGKVKNSGDDFVPELMKKEKGVFESKEDLEKAAEDFVKNIK